MHVPRTAHDALELRFRSGARTLGPPDVGAFSGPPGDASLHPRPREVGVAQGTARACRGPMLVVFFEHGGYGIPAISEHRELPELGDWSLRPTRFGYLAAVPRVRARTHGPRAAWIVAACLPLGLAPLGARAEPPAEPAQVQQPRTIPMPPTIPPLPGDSADAPEPTADSRVPTPPPAATCPEPAAAADAPAPAAPDADVADAAWQGVVGYDVELKLAGDVQISGRVTALQARTFTLIDRKTGIVRVLQKRAVQQLRVRVPTPLPTRDGTGLLAGGGVLTAIGGPVFLAGAVMLGICPSCTFLHIPLLLSGGGALGGGIPMIVKGARRRADYREARQDRWVPQPTVARTPHGWTGGLRLRF